MPLKSLHSFGISIFGNGEMLPNFQTRARCNRPVFGSKLWSVTTGAKYLQSPPKPSMGCDLDLLQFASVFFSFIFFLLLTSETGLIPLSTDDREGSQ